MKYALVENGRIAQIEAKPFPVAKPLIWVEVPNDTTTMDRYEKDAVVKDVAPSLVAEQPKTKAQRVQAMLSAYGLTLADLKAELAK
jgi:hypothetical protein